MPLYTFDASRLKYGFDIVKSVKPDNSDFIIKFNKNQMFVSSSDKIRFISSCITSSEIEPYDSYDSYESSCFLLASERSALFNSKWDKIKVHVNEKSLVISTEGDNQSRKAYLKHRLVNNYDFVRIPDLNSCNIKASVFDKILYYASCSAIAKDKSEDDRKISQIHFYPESKSSFSNARSHATKVDCEQLSKLDLSISSHDVSVIRSLCSKLKDAFIDIYSNDDRIFIREPQTNTILTFPKTMIAKPEIFQFDENLYSTKLLVNLNAIKDSVSWSNLVLEGSQRLRILSGVDNIKFFDSSDNELASTPAQLVKGQLDADFPAKILYNLVNFMDSDNIIVMYSYKDMPYLMQLSQSINVGDCTVVVSHYLQSMKRKPHE
jgi:hypothetical protein